MSRQLAAAGARGEASHVLLLKGVEADRRKEVERASRRKPACAARVIVSRSSCRSSFAHGDCETLILPLWTGRLHTIHREGECTVRWAEARDGSHTATVSFSHEAALSDTANQLGGGTC